MYLLAKELKIFDVSKEMNAKVVYKTTNHIIGLLEGDRKFLRIKKKI